MFIYYVVYTYTIKNICNIYLSSKGIITTGRGFRLCVKDTNIETNISHKSRDSYLARDWRVHIMYKAAVKCLSWS